MGRSIRTGATSPVYPGPCGMATGLGRATESEDLPTIDLALLVKRVDYLGVEETNDK